MKFNLASGAAYFLLKTSVIFATSTDPLSPRLRLTAALAVFLVAFLAIVSASPHLHASLHADDSAGPAHGDVSGHGCPDTDEGCAVTLFGTGVYFAIAILLLSALLRFAGVWSPALKLAAPCAQPRYWLPPLCGPP